jgi:hypothetical protein
MVAVAVLSVGATMISAQHQHYEDATRRAIAVESVARALDQEMERMRACPDLACIERLAGRSTDELDVEVESWIRAEIDRAIEPGPNGTLKVTLTADAPHLRAQRKLVALLWVEK